MLQSYFDSIAQIPVALPPPWRSGLSREGRPLAAFRFGRGPKRISLLAGCHADEPTGPMLLRRLVTFLHGLPADHPLLCDYSWWIVPHANPDGEGVNRRWYQPGDEAYDLAAYLRFAERSAPEDDLEFGFPALEGPAAKRPENAFIFECWRSAGGPFQLHASLHSMAIASGAWFLIDPQWGDRSGALQSYCRAAAESLGYSLFDVDRQGEKGFSYLGPGFTTRPNHRAMQQYFLSRKDERQASFFHPSSMESIRSLGGDCLTLVSELPLFIYPCRHRVRSWPNPDFQDWKAQLEAWKAALILEKMEAEEVNRAARKAGMTPMPVADQMRLQWALITGGMMTISENADFDG